MRELPYGNDRLTSKSNAADTRKKQKGGIAQLARASALQAEGRRFDSDYLHKKKTSIRASFFCGEGSTPSQALPDSPGGACRCPFVTSGISVLRFPWKLRPPMCGWCRLKSCCVFFCGDIMFRTIYDIMRDVKF